MLNSPKCTCYLYIIIYVHVHMYVRTGGDSKEVQDLRMWHADTINELEKTRKLLQLQHNINKDYQSEVKAAILLHAAQILLHATHYQQGIPGLYADL